LFLTLWLAAPLLLSVVFVPFQAVRHLLPALAPLVILGVRAFGGLGGAVPRVVLAGALLLQAGVSLAVARADAEYAASYRDFAARVPALIAELAGPEAVEARIWYLGHWGWMFYAERAGFAKLHSSGPYPRVGDYLVVPAYVDKGKVLERVPRVAAAMRQVEQVVYPGTIGIRTMHPTGAGFYAMFSRPRHGKPPPVPYRLTRDVPLEIFDIHRLERAGSAASEKPGGPGLLR
jgi:hypothetical protein